jgi:hypothetical protein
MEEAKWWLEQYKPYHVAVVSPVLCVFISTITSRVCPAVMHVLLFLHIYLPVSILIRMMEYCRMAVPRVTGLAHRWFVHAILTLSVVGLLIQSSHETCVVCRDYSWYFCAFASDFLICRMEMVSKPLLMFCSYMQYVQCVQKYCGTLVHKDCNLPTFYVQNMGRDPWQWQWTNRHVMDHYPSTHCNLI